MELDRIKQSKDCVVTHIYERGRLVEVRYRSSLGEAVERLAEPIPKEEQSPRMDADSVPLKRKHNKED